MQSPLGSFSIDQVTWPYLVKWKLNNACFNQVLLQLDPSIHEEQPHVVI